MELEGDRACSASQAVVKALAFTLCETGCCWRTVCNVIRPVFEWDHSGHHSKNRLKGDKKEIRRPVKRSLL